MFRSCGFVFALGLPPIQITCRLAEFSTRGITFSIKLSTPLSSVNPHNFVANEDAQVLGLPVSSTIFLNCRDGTSFNPDGPWKNTAIERHVIYYPRRVRSQAIANRSVSGYARHYRPCFSLVPTEIWKLGSNWISANAGNDRRDDFDSIQNSLLRSQ
jgi:hypothetical protein